VVGTSGIDEWSAVRAEFDLSDNYIHMSALLISSHPQQVREAIEPYRREMDRNPVLFVNQHNFAAPDVGTRSDSPVPRRRYTQEGIGADLDQRLRTTGHVSRRCELHFGCLQLTRY
jgi:hypothetical protein